MERNVKVSMSIQWQVMPSFLSNFHNDATKAKNFIEKFGNDGERADEYLKRFKDVHEASEFLDKFNGHGNEANEFLKKFTDGNKANEFAQMFNSSFDCASKFIQSFTNSKEALEHLVKIKKECDRRTDYSCGENCKWIFDEKTKTLFIRGRGEMKDYGWDYNKGVTTTP